jgi:hypothetical protein
MKMIALVSQQRMQNLLPLLQKGTTYSEIILVLSKEQSTGQPKDDFQRSADDLKATLENTPGLSLNVCISDKWVDPFNIGNVEEIIRQLIIEYGKDVVVVNISGGTKPMAIGALQAAQVLGVRSLYTNTENKELIWLYPDKIVHEPVRIQGLDVKSYIQAHGEKVSSFQKTDEFNPSQIVWADSIIENYDVIYKKVIMPVMLKLRKDRNYPVYCDIEPTHRQLEVIKRLDQDGLWDWNQNTQEIIITDEVRGESLYGGWVELCVALQLERSRLFDDVLLNVTLEGIDGDLDVVAVSQGKLVIIECKSNMKRTDLFGKLNTFRDRLGGTFALVYYARAGEDYRKDIEKTCKEYKLNGAFFGTELRTIGQDIGSKV